MEDKVKDQLEAANPEPIIEEVVSTPFFRNMISFVEVVVPVAVLTSFLPSGFGQPRPEKTRLVDFLKIIFQPVQCIKSCYEQR